MSAPVIRAGALLLALLWPASALSEVPRAAEPVGLVGEVTVASQAPRVHGWWLGDTLLQHVEIRMPEGVAIEPASLPRPRAVDYWLDLREVSQKETSGGVVLTFTWQTFYAALEPSRRTVPAHMIRLSDGREVRLPGFEFVTSPIRPIMAPSTQDRLRPDPAFQLVATDGDRRRLVLFGTGFVLVAGLLAYHQAWGPFRTRPVRPFTIAARRISLLPKSETQARRQILHRALDDAFGRSLIGAELSIFLKENIKFNPLRNELHVFFEKSDAVFFARSQEPDTEAKARATEEIAALARRLSAIERGRA
ncbi:hypothetical protein [Breoghania sp. JC706]|uniref:hypothetical protein n=1 Tax=Breoghania sp. JC706 TaxID=3117732 RepID=UPI003008EEF0